MSLRLSLNGEAREFPSPLTVEGLLKHLALDPRKVAVERNLEIVPRSSYERVGLSEGDRLEIVHFIGGRNDAARIGPAARKPFVDPGRTLRLRLHIRKGKYKGYAENGVDLL